MIFVDQNGEPRIIYHNCDTSRKGQPISKEELHKFGVELLADLYQKEGMILKDINRTVGYEYPQFVMEGKNKKLYYVAVKTTIFPNAPFSLPKNDCNEIISLAAKYNATPVFAGLGFATVSEDMTKAVCGGAYFVSFKGLQPL